MIGMELHSPALFAKWSNQWRVTITSSLRQLNFSSSPLCQDAIADLSSSHGVLRLNWRRTIPGLKSYSSLSAAMAHRCWNRMTGAPLAKTAPRCVATSTFSEVNWVQRFNYRLVMLVSLAPFNLSCSPSFLGYKQRLQSYCPAFPWLKTPVKQQRRRLLNSYPSVTRSLHEVGWAWLSGWAYSGLHWCTCHCNCSTQSVCWWSAPCWRLYPS